MSTAFDEGVVRLLDVFADSPTVNAGQCLWALKRAAGNVDVAASYILMLNAAAGGSKTAKSRRAPQQQSTGTPQSGPSITKWTRQRHLPETWTQGSVPMVRRNAGLRDSPRRHDTSDTTMGAGRTPDAETGNQRRPFFMDALPGRITRPPTLPSVLPVPSATAARSPLPSASRARSPDVHQPSEKPPTSAFSLLRWPADSTSSANAGPAPKRARTRRAPSRNIIISTPEDVARHLPTCALFPAFLEPLLADALLRKMLADCNVGWEYPRYTVADRLVTGARRSALYVEPWASGAKNAGGSEGHEPTADDDARGSCAALQQPAVASPVDELDAPDILLTSLDSLASISQRAASSADALKYIEQGQIIRNPVPYPTEMQQARTLVEDHVNAMLALTERSQLEDTGKWVANACVANHYALPSESVQWHSDRLTHIGPCPTIASISLGAGRAFRLRGIAPAAGKEGDEEVEAADPATYVVVLRHGDLFVMGAGTQELYRHDVPAITANLPTVERHPIAGKARVGLTFRYYRPEYAADRTPRCWCGNLTELRCATKTRGKNRGQYFFHCAGAGTDEEKEGDEQRRPEHQVPPGGKCNFFLWLADWHTKIGRG